MLRLRRASEPIRLDMTPLIDTVFLLLTFFVFALAVTARLKVSDIRLPVAATGESLRGGAAILLSLHADGSLSIDNQRIQWDQAIAALERRRAEDPDAALFIAPDKGAPSGDLFRLMDRLGEAGIRDLRFLRQPERDATEPPPED